MGSVPDARRALALPWLRPTAAGLLALTDDPPDRAAVLDCPGTVAHVLRYVRPTPDPTTFHFSPDAIGQPGILAAAAGFVEYPDGWPRDWTRTPPAQKALHFGRRAARVAAGIASETKLCSPDSAWAAALLVPLGWYAAGEGAVDDPATIARRLAFRWRLPTAFAITIGSLAVPAEDAERLGGHAGLHRVVQAAVAAVERRFGSWPLSQSHRGHQSPPIAMGGLCPDLPNRLAAEISLVPTRTADPDPGPRVLAKLLRATATARQRGGSAVVADLETQLDALTGLLAEVRADFDTALRDAKLGAMAEFAAGAGHEINNPLAVISGNAQLLLAGEADPDRQRRLGSVIRSAARIHDILVGTRQFARPPASSPVAVMVNRAVEAALEANRMTAAERGVKLEPLTGPVLAVRADAGQLQRIISNLVRNSVEAAPPNGWVRVSVESSADRVTIAVEDSGPGPTAEDVPHLFDPFFSGREAGRGRGLGLSVAWQLARQNGGSVSFNPTADGTTRFTLSLPSAPALDVSSPASEERRSA